MAVVIYETAGKRRLLGVQATGTAVDTSHPEKIVVGSISYWNTAEDNVLSAVELAAGDAYLGNQFISDYSYDGATIAINADGTARQADAALPLPVPPIVSMAQARIALINSGHFAAVDAAVEGIGANTPTWTWWHYATIVERTHPLVASLGAAVGLSSSDIDALFRAAILIQ